MKLSDQCCSLEQAKKLKELEIEQSAYFSWFGDEKQRLLDNGNELSVSNWVFIRSTEPINSTDDDHRVDTETSRAIASTFTVSELGIMLPHCIHAQKEGFGDNTYWTLSFQSHLVDMLKKIEWQQWKTQAEAMAYGLIYLLESGKIQAADVNKRLNS